MMERTKVKFSAEEAALMIDAGTILTKNRIIQKVYDLFGAVSARCSDLLTTMSLPEEVLSVPPKISKGENYLGLPYVILDQPRYFSNDDVLAIRTMFWWGHYFSVTLHLKGKYKDVYADAVIDKYQALSAAGVYVSIAEDEWHHRLDDEHYAPLSSMEKDRFSMMVMNRSFLKITFMVPMELNERLEEELLKKIREAISLLH